MGGPKAFLLKLAFTKCVIARPDPKPLLRNGLRVKEKFDFMKWRSLRVSLFKEVKRTQKVSPLKSVADFCDRITFLMSINNSDLVPCGFVSQHPPITTSPHHPICLLVDDLTGAF